LFFLYTWALLPTNLFAEDEVLPTLLDLSLTGIVGHTPSLMPLVR
jgi:hypothetical protein